MSSPAPEYTEHGDDWLSPQNAQKKPDTSEIGSSVASPMSSPLSFHPDIRSPGLESAWTDDQGKEVVPPEQQPEYLKSKYPLGPYDQGEDTVRPKRRICGIPLAVFLLLLVCIVAVAIGLGVGLGVGLGTKHKYGLIVHISKKIKGLRLTAQPVQMEYRASISQKAAHLTAVASPSPRIPLEAAATV